MGTKTHSYSSVLAYSADDVTYTNVADCKMVQLPGLEAAEVDITHLESANAVKEFMAGWLDSGEMSFEVYMTHAQAATLMGLVRDRTTRHWRVTLPLVDSQSTNGTIKVQGFAKTFEFSEISSESDDAISMPFTIKCTGNVTFTAGS